MEKRRMPAKMRNKSCEFLILGDCAADVSVHPLKRSVSQEKSTIPNESSRVRMQHQVPVLRVLELGTLGLAYVTTFIRD